MDTETLFKSYPADSRYMAHYAELQERYFRNARKSDLVLAAMIGETVERLGRPDAALLDIGCSTGALLHHLHRAFPELRLIGGDLSSETIERCRADERLAGIPFEVMNILDLKRPEGGYDVVVANAIFYGFSPRLFEDALASVAKVLNPGGSLLVFDYLHPFHQDVAIVEYSDIFPDGHPLHYRSFPTVTRALDKAGFGAPHFRPFELDLDLSHPGFESIHTYTVPTADGRRLLFRGSLSQPWCHMAAKLNS